MCKCMLPVISRGLNLKPTCNRKNHAHVRASCGFLKTFGADPETGRPFAVSGNRLKSEILYRRVQVDCICYAGHGFDADKGSSLSLGRHRLPDHRYRAPRAEKDFYSLIGRLDGKPCAPLRVTVKVGKFDIQCFCLTDTASPAEPAEPLMEPWDEFHRIVGPSRRF